jgi:hypothetical protein
MTEIEWLVCEDPTPMLEVLRGKASERKVRLFAVVCCRRIWHLLIPPQQEVVIVLEDYADGRASRERLVEALDTASAAARNTPTGGSDPVETAVHGAVVSACGLRHTFLSEMDLVRELSGAAQMAVSAVSRHANASRRAEQLEQVTLLHEVVANPFRPIRPDPAWQTPNALTLARTIYDDRRWELLPLLADLLEEAGCPANVSAHCRGPGPHVRGCWVIDLVRSVD